MPSGLIAQSQDKGGNVTDLRMSDENEITLPLYSTLTEEDVRFICQTLKDCLQG